VGTVREDYSADGSAWDYLPHDHARSRAYRWGEDGLAGSCDIEQRLCLGLALWNGRDPILKERAFGLTGAEGNHGEDIKEYWWYLDAIPSHAWNRWRYHYPQAAYPYQDLIEQNGARSRLQPEYELIDTGVFDADRYWIVEVAYAKDAPGDLLMAITVTNAGPEAETLHVLPTAWFRNTWSWDAGTAKPVIAAAGPDEALAELGYALDQLRLDGALPALGWRIGEHTVMGHGPHGADIDPGHVAQVLRGLYYETALAGSRNSLLPTLEVTTADHVLFGTDWPAAPSRPSCATPPTWLRRLLRGGTASGGARQRPQAVPPVRMTG
jgi:hypothetical protein